MATVNDSANSPETTPPISLTHPPSRTITIPHSKLRYQNQLLQSSNHHHEQQITSRKTKTVSLPKLITSTDNIISKLNNDMKTLLNHVSGSSAESDKRLFLDFSTRHCQMVNEIRNLALDLADLENQMKTQSSSKSPWKQVRCQCKEEIDKEVVSLMEAECSCMICEEIFVDATVTTCGHTFCNLCIKKWYSSSPKQDCPLCRQPLAVNTVKRNVAVDSFVTRLHLRLSDKIKKARNRLLNTRRCNVLKFDAKLLSFESILNPPISKIIPPHDDEDFRRIRTQIRQELSSSSSSHPPVTLDLDKVDASVQTDCPSSPFDSFDSNPVSTLEELYQLLQTDRSPSFDPKPSHDKGPKPDDNDDDVLILPTPRKSAKILDFIDISDDKENNSVGEASASSSLSSSPSSSSAASSVQNLPGDEEPILLPQVPSTSSSTSAATVDLQTMLEPSLNFITTPTTITAVPGPPPFESLVSSTTIPSTTLTSALEPPSVNLSSVLESSSDSIITPEIASAALSALRETPVVDETPPVVSPTTIPSNFNSALERLTSSTSTQHLVPIRLGIKRDSNGKLLVFRSEPR
ncbi:uncharacterized protein LOC110850057 isoform X2 [Folsomia candida]|nr:uncharacterized protein LOC110850057 isoform X2 [Folsomia candida]